jgi:hypothetical protein
MNMFEVNLKETGKDSFYINPTVWGNPKGYYCSITNKHCVAAIAASWIFLSDRLDKDVINRCPSKITIDDVARK